MEKSDKCMGVPLLLGLVPGLPPQSLAYVSANADLSVGMNKGYNYYLSCMDGLHCIVFSFIIKPIWQNAAIIHYTTFAQCTMNANVT